MSETKITQMLCQGCGANLDVAEGVRFVSCNYCNAKLEIVREASTTHTRVLEKVADDVKVIRLQNELERLDREWDSERENYMVTGKHGSKSVPSKTGSAMGGLFIAGFGIFWTVMAAGIGAKTGGPGAIFPLFGVCFVLVGLFQSARAFGKAGEHDTGETAYRRRRKELVERLEREKQ